MKLFDLSGRIALVPGSRRGIGLALARALADAGAEIVLNARHAGRLEEARAALAAGGHRVHAIPFDVTDPAAVAASVEHIEREAGPIVLLRRGPPCEGVGG